jgi:hypothetical protein
MGGAGSSGTDARGGGGRGLVGGEVVMQAREDQAEVRLIEGTNRQKLHVACAGAKAAIGDERVEMDIEAKVRAKALDDDEHAAVQAGAGLQGVPALDLAAQGMGDASRELPTHDAEQPAVVAEAHRHRARERQHPLPPRYGREPVVDEQRRRLADAPAHAGRTQPAALAGKRHAHLVAAAAARGNEEAALITQRACARA